MTLSMQDRMNPKVGAIFEDGGGAGGAVKHQTRSRLSEYHTWVTVGLGVAGIPGSRLSLPLPCPARALRGQTQMIAYRQKVMRASDPDKPRPGAPQRSGGGNR